MGITVNELMFTTVANDDSIELPIFQRGKVWSDEKKFGLVLSAILNYPVGAISILSEQINLDDGSREIKNHLLDGQQRTDAIQSALQNPSIVLTWAAKTLNLGDSASVDQIAMKLRYRTLCYFGAITPDEDKEISERIKTCTWNKGQESRAAWRERKEELIRNEYETATNECNYVTEFGDPLALIPTLSEFSNFLFRFKFRNSKTGANPLSALLLKKSYYEDNKLPYRDGTSLHEVRFFRKLGGYSAWLREERIPGLGTHESFQEWWLMEHAAYIRDTGPNKNAIRTKILDNWADLIEPILRSLNEFLDMYGAAKIGKIHIESDGIRTYNTYDMMKIFDLINTQGEPLSLVEILAAKYYWREKVTCNESFIKKIQKVNDNTSHLNFLSSENEDGEEELDGDKLTKWHIASCYYDILSEEKILGGVLE